MIENPPEIHLNALQVALNIRDDSTLPIRAKKERVLGDVGFSKGENVAIRGNFNLPEDGTQEDIETYLVNQLNQGKFTSMLFRDGKWESMGGAPVVYIHSSLDINQRLMFEGGRLTSAIAHDGETLQIDHPIKLQTFSRTKSIRSNVSGFTNYDGSKEVALGGGFRLQIDGVETVGSNTNLVVSSEFSFDDMGSRVLSLSCKQDQDVPRFNMIFKIPVVDGNLVFPTDGTTLSYKDIKDAKGVAQIVLSNLFLKDGSSVNRIIKALLSTRPTMGIHQLEGIFSIPSEEVVSAEVIDFDGLDACDMDGIGSELTTKEKFIQTELDKAHLLTEDPERLLEYSEFKSSVKRQVFSVIESDILPEDSRAEIKTMFEHNDYDFPRDMTENIRLGRLLNILDIGWNESANNHIKTLESGNDKLMLVSIEGFDIGVWVKDGKAVQINRLEDSVKEIEKLTGRMIVQAHISSLKEGD